MPQKAQILFTCTNEFKDAVGEFAAQNRKSVSLIIREAVAKYIEYDLCNEEVVDGRRKYATAEERKDAQNARNRKARNEVAKLIAIFEHEQHVQDVNVLVDYLKKKNVSLDDE